MNDWDITGLTYSQIILIWFNKVFFIYDLRKTIKCIEILISTTYSNE